MSKKRKRPDHGQWWDLPLDLESLLITVGALLALALGWVFVELLAPALLAAAYALLVGALRRVANDAHECEGNLPRSIGWGVLWASLYTLPLAGIVALARYF
jgi:hypothetical protein